MSDATTAQARTAAFPPTQWSVVLAARATDAPAIQRRARDHSAALIGIPFTPTSGDSDIAPHDAQDLTQEFFARLLAGAYLERADREKGRFRTFLLTALRRFMVNEWDRARAQKRGGGQQPLPLDGELAERLYAAGPAAEESPEKVYDHHCAVTLLNAALQELQKEFTVTGRSRRVRGLEAVFDRRTWRDSLRRIGRASEPRCRRGASGGASVSQALPPTVPRASRPDRRAA